MSKTFFFLKIFGRKKNNRVQNIYMAHCSGASRSEFKIVRCNFGQ